AGRTVSRRGASGGRVETSARSRQLPVLEGRHSLSRGRQLGTRRDDKALAGEDREQLVSGRTSRLGEEARRQHHPVTEDGREKRQNILRDDVAAPVQERPRPDGPIEG